jgi:hypothetical protein
MTISSTIAVSFYVVNSVKDQGTSGKLWQSGPGPILTVAPYLNININNEYQLE